MNPANFTRTLMLTSAFLFSILTCAGQDDSSDALTGTWTKMLNQRALTIEIMSDHTYQVEFAGDAEIDVFGSCEISGTQVTFNDEGGEYGADVPGTYEFKVNGTTVTFTEVDDPVYGRRSLLEGNWSKSAEAAD